MRAKNPLAILRFLSYEYDMSQELKELKANLDAGVNRIKAMAGDLDTEDLSKLNGQLQRIIEYTAEVAKLIDDLEVVQREVDAKKAITYLIDAGFIFHTVEIDGMRFNITDKDEMYFFPMDDSLRQ